MDALRSTSVVCKRFDFLLLIECEYALALVLFKRALIVVTQSLCVCTRMNHLFLGFSTLSETIMTKPFDTVSKVFC